MRCSLDKVLLDARQLATRIRATDETADMLIKQASDAHNKVIAKKQCQEETMSFEELNQISKTRPRSRLMMCIAAENKQLELLKQENKVLRTSLTEYETTFEMIMKKFRKHKNILKKLDQLEKGDLNSSTIIPQTDSSSFGTENQILCLCSKITKLQKAIEEALMVDNKVTDDLSEIETKLFYENQELRRLIEINEEFKNDLLMNDSSELRSQTSLKKVSVDKTQLDLPRANAASSPQSSSSSSLSSSTSSSSSSSSIIMNGISPKENRIFSSKLKFPRLLNNHHSSNNKSEQIHSKSNAASEKNGSSFGDDDNDKNDNENGSEDVDNNDEDDDHSSIASDASVKTLI